MRITMHFIGSYAIYALYFIQSIYRVCTEQVQSIYREDRYKGLANLLTSQFPI